MARAFLPLAAALLIGAAPPAPPAAQVQPLNFLPAIAGDYFPLASTATGTTYHIYVRYPQGYAQAPERRYPVVYLLDGDSLFPLLGAHHLFLTIDDKIPDAIVVGIACGSFAPRINRRDLDYGPGSAAFEKFLANELMPRIESTTRADSARRVLVGQSYGGSFVLYSALSEPDLFWARIASNPSFRLHAPKLWADAAPAKRKDLRLFVVSGTENPPEPRQQALEWVSRWNSRPRPWAVETIEIPGGTHAADITTGYRAAMRKLFGWAAAAPADPH